MQFSKAPNNLLKHLKNGQLKQLLGSLRPLLLPLLLAIFPPLFLYGNNVEILLLPSLIRTLILYLIIAGALSFFIRMFKLGHPVEMANAAFVFLIFFNVYGIVYSFLLKLDLFLVEHYTLLPFFVLLGVYSSWLITKMKGDRVLLFWNFMTTIFSLLVIFNILTILPVEIKKYKISAIPTSVEVVDNESVNDGYPDIYYIVLDEFSGFEPMREYWNYQEIDKFEQFLKNRSFFVAENSHGSSIDTLHEMATRLNYQEYDLYAPGSQEIWFDAIANNRVMRYLKSKGYSTVVFSELQFAYPSAPSIKSDYTFTYNQNSINDLGILFDEFGIMIADNTMLRAFSNLYKLNNPRDVQHRNMIYFTVNKVANLNEVPSPKFVYVHLMLPHFPFMFDGKGSVVDPRFHQNWNYYLGNYEFAIHVAETMIENIFTSADPANLPVVVLQSDHGARNQKTGSPDNVILENYPEESKTSIIFSIYMAGSDYSDISQNIDPINTFPIIFNYLFDADISLKNNIEEN